jgi:hypothetical protein
MPDCAHRRTERDSRRSSAEDWSTTSGSCRVGSQVHADLRPRARACRKRPRRPSPATSRGRPSPSRPRPADPPEAHFADRSRHLKCALRARRSIAKKVLSSRWPLEDPSGLSSRAARLHREVKRQTWAEHLRESLAWPSGEEDEWRPRTHFRSSSAKRLVGYPIASLKLTTGGSG